MVELIRLVAAIAVFGVAGWTLLRFIGRLSGVLGMGVGVGAAVSFMLGMGLVSLQMFFYSLLSIPFGFFSVEVPWGALFCVSFVIPSHFAPGSGAARAHGGVAGTATGAGMAEYALWAIIAFQVAYALAYSTLLPLAGWDAWAIWFLKARAFFIDGGVSSSFLLVKGAAGYAHPDYPLLVPLSAAWLYTVLGEVSESAAKVIYPLQFISMLLIFHHAAGRFTTRRIALLFTALLSLTPIIMVHSAGLPVKISILYTGDFTGYADLPLAAFFLGGVAFFYLYMAEGRRGYMILAAFFFAVGAWTKNEGVPLALMGVGSMAAYAMINERRRGRGWVWPVLACAAAFALFIVPWSVYKSYHAITSEYASSFDPAVVKANIGRVGPIAGYMLSYMFKTIGLYNFIWWLYVLSLVLNWRGLLRAPQLIINALFLLQMVAYGLVYVITPADLTWHVTTSLDRLILHVTPLVMFIAAINVSAFFAHAGAGSRQSVRDR